MTEPGKYGPGILLFENICCASIPGAEGASALIQETWQICDRDSFSSKVACGPFQGQDLHTLLETFGSVLSGTACNAKRFPLEVKIFQTLKKLPLQLCGTPQSCASIPGAVPGTKFWYILSAEKGARIMAGIKQTSSRMRFMESLSANDAESQMQLFDVFANDAYFLPGGRLHNMGGACKVLEIGTASPTVFTLEQSSGTPEEKLRMKYALSCVDFMDRTVARITGVCDEVSRNRKFPVINRCPSFHAEELLLVSDWHDTTSPGTSFHILSAASGSFQVGKEGSFERVPEGSSCLVPACYGSYIILPEKGEKTQCRIIKTSL